MMGFGGFEFREAMMQESESDTPTVLPVRDAAPSAPIPAPKVELRPEIRRIVERNWPRDEEALRSLGR